MNPAPSQPPVSSVPTTPSVDSTPISPPPPSVVTTNATPPTPANPPPTNPPPPTTNYPLPTDNPSPHHKFPFMMITLFLAVILAGLAGSFLFLSYKGQNSAKTPTQIQVTPPVSAAATQITPTESATNPFATASADLGTNPFASPTAVTNPFGTYQNPFSGATVSATPQAVQNPFE